MLSSTKTYRRLTIDMFQLSLEEQRQILWLLTQLVNEELTFGDCMDLIMDRDRTLSKSSASSTSSTNGSPSWKRLVKEFQKQETVDPLGPIMLASLERVMNEQTGCQCEDCQLQRSLGPSFE